MTAIHTLFLLLVSIGQTIPLEPHGIYYEASLDVSPSGTICIVNPKGKLLLIHQGGEVKTVGRRGQRPGEFQGLSSVNFDHQHQRWIAYDEKAQRLSMWSEGGEYKGNVDIKPMGNPRYKSLFWKSHSLSFSLDQPVKLIRAPRGQEQGDVLYQFPFFEERISTKLTVDGNELKVFYLWDPSVLLDANRDLIVVNDNLTNKMIIISAANQTYNKIELPFKPKFVSEADKEHFLEGMPANLKKNLKHWSAPSHWPIVRRVITDGTQVWAFGQQIEGNFPFVVYNAQGQKMKAGETAAVPECITNNQGYSYRHKEGQLFLDISGY